MRIRKLKAKAEFSTSTERSSSIDADRLYLFSIWDWLKVASTKITLSDRYQLARHYVQGDLGRFCCINMEQWSTNNADKQDIS